MFSTRPPRVQTPKRGRGGPVAHPARVLPDRSQGISMRRMLSVTATIAVAKIGPSSEPETAQK